jgi:hypothetical protein
MTGRVLARTGDDCDHAIVFFVAFLAAIGGVIAFAGLVIGSVVELVRAAWRRSTSSILNAIVGLLGAAGLFFASRAAAVLAERRNHWVDRNHDGGLDGAPMYDWVDVNVETWGQYAAIGLVVVLVAVAIARAVIRTSCSRWLTTRE